MKIKDKLKNNFRKIKNIKIKGFKKIKFKKPKNLNIKKIKILNLKFLSFRKNKFLSLPSKIVKGSKTYNNITLLVPKTKREKNYYKIFLPISLIVIIIICVIIGAVCGEVIHKKKIHVPNNNVPSYIKKYYVGFQVPDKKYVFSNFQYMSYDVYTNQWVPESVPSVASVNSYQDISTNNAFPLATKEKYFSTFNFYTSFDVITNYQAAKYDGISFQFKGKKDIDDFATSTIQNINYPPIINGNPVNFFDFVYKSELDIENFYLHVGFYNVVKKTYTISTNEIGIVFRNK